MHERSLVRALFGQIYQLQRNHGAERVVAVKVSVGEFAGVDMELFRGAFGEMVEDSPIRGARLELQEVPLEACCESCLHEFAVVKFCFACPHCKDSRVNIVRGDGLMLESVTLEETDDECKFG